VLGGGVGGTQAEVRPVDVPPGPCAPQHTTSTVRTHLHHIHTLICVFYYANCLGLGPAAMPFASLSRCSLWGSENRNIFAIDVGYVCLFSGNTEINPDESALQCFALRCSVSKCVAVHSSVMQCIAACCSALQCEINTEMDSDEIRTILHTCRMLARGDAGIATCMKRDLYASNICQKTHILAKRIVRVSHIALECSLQ